MAGWTRTSAPSTRRPGVIGEVLERRLNAQGYTLGHFPSSIYMSTLGGWLAARSAGQLSSQYGKIEDMVLSVPRGARHGRAGGRRRARPFRGPDLAQLLIGSEGTLCAFTGATLRVHPVPEHRAFRGFEFRTVAGGLEAIRRLFRAGLRPAVVRLYDPFDTALVGRRSRAPQGDDARRRCGARCAATCCPRCCGSCAPQTLGRPAPAEPRGAPAPASAC